MRDLTVLFADLQGSTPLFEHRGDQQGAALLVRYHAIVARVVSEHHGRVVKTMGDGAMAVFEAPRSAVLAGFGIHEALLAHRAGPELWLPARVGIHRGPMMASELMPGQIDYLGHTINVASRLQTAAEPGELTLSAAVVASPELKALLAERRVSTNLVSVKGVSEPLLVHRVGFLGEITLPDHCRA